MARLPQEPRASAALMRSRKPLFQSKGDRCAGKCQPWPRPCRSEGAGGRARQGPPARGTLPPCPFPHTWQAEPGWLGEEALQHRPVPRLPVLRQPVTNLFSELMAKSGQLWQAPGPPALAQGLALDTDRIGLTTDCDLLGKACDLSQMHRGREWGMEGLSAGGKSHLSVTKGSRRHTWLQV